MYPGIRMLMLTTMHVAMPVSMHNTCKFRFVVCMWEHAMAPLQHVGEDQLNTELRATCTQSIQADEASTALNARSLKKAI